MKNHKNIKYFIVYLVISCNITYKANSQSKDLPYTFYPKEYETLSQTDWPKMKETFNLFLSFKTIEEVSNYTDPHKAGYTLARMAQINWDGALKKEVSSYLTNFLAQLLQGRSYLKTESISFPQYISSQHPIYLPKNVIWALFLIDNEAAFSIIKDNWATSSNSGVNSYLLNLREFTLWLFETSNKKASNEFFLNNYSLIKNNLNTNEIDNISRIKLQCEISRINDQKKAWEYLWKNSESSSSSVLTDKTQFLWYKNILLMKNVYQNINVKTIINICDTTTSVNKKYIFLYAACFNINNQISTNPNYKVDESIINYINKANENIKTENIRLKIATKENDFLMTTYDSMKANLLKKGNN